MQRCDTSCGLSGNEIRAIKYSVKTGIARQLPLLSDEVETKLFLQGRNPWIYSWSLLNEGFPIGLDEAVSLEVVAKLKREFHDYLSAEHHRLSCRAKIQRDDLYRPEISIREGSAEQASAPNTRS